ncbi:MFS transporter [Alkalibaculum sp. M08DMB]|uniref:MFS transporter n=1 Tax=Alkalibaculum sporogenes TaxID=2655001 RepID=A0A6A7K4J0_9FIRM|nr:MFS transporter [Alkalibaculum sporogenes]MPW24369.1 MFS transporter [Alkalibaculum sporogenes]
MTSNETNKKVTIWTKGFTLVLIANICTSLAQFGVNTYVSTYMGYLGTGPVLTGVIAGLYFGVAFLMRPISGPAITVLNKKMLMIIVYSSGIVINLGYAFFPTTEIFVIMRVLHGVQLAFYGSLALTVAADSLPESKMASGLGVYGLSYIAAQAFGPTVAVFSRSIGERFMGERGGFMGIFLMAALLAAISVIPCIMLPNNKVSKADIASLGAWYKNIVAKEAIVPSTVAMLMAIGMVLFGTYLIPYGEWKNINNISLYFTVSAFITLIVRPIAGKLTDKYGSAKIFYPSVTLYMCAFIAVSYATDLKLIIVGAVCAAIGMSAAGPAVQVMVMQSVPPIRRGVASNTNFLGMDLGSFFGPTIAGVILARYDYTVMFRLAAIPIVIAMIVFALGWKAHLRQREYLQLKAVEQEEELVE